MALPRPFVTRDFTFYSGEIWQTQLSFAVWITDAFTKENPEIELIVRLEENKNLEPIKNTSGYYCFTGLTPDQYKITVESDPIEGDWYFSATGEIDMEADDFDPLNPVLEIELTPKPYYPFPGNATLVRGVVRTPAPANAPVEGATVSVTGKALQTQTDANGEFVLYFKEISTEDITINIRKNGRTRSRTKKINKGKTLSLGVIEFPES
jgi:hypothetical protein